MSQSSTNSPKTTNYSKSVIIASCIATGCFLYHIYRKYAAIPSQQWLQNCPKLELHAHLHGSIRMATLAELYGKAASDPNLKYVIKPNEDPTEQIQSILKEHKSFNEVFAMFDVIHRVVCSKDVLIRITNEVLLDFAHQNVKYLELRSTPRALSHSGHSRKDYVDIVLDIIREFPLKYPQFGDMVIRFIVTINNAKPLAEAEESLDIIEAYLQSQRDEESLIVGVDFAPRFIEGKTFKYYETVLSKARKIGMKVTIHFAEYYDRTEQDLVLKWRPDRLGHAVNLTDEDYEYLLADPIPIEMCPTSNIYTKSIDCYFGHPFKKIKQIFQRKYGNKYQYPMLFCTDDCGVFATDLVSEWLEMCQAHQLTKKDVESITMNAIDFIFATDATKQKLRQNMRHLWT